MSYLVAVLCVVDKSKNKQFLGIFGIGGVGGKGFIGMDSMNTMGIDEEREQDVFNEYENIGGTKNFKQFKKIHDIFLDETLDIYVYGDTTKHNSRSEALDSVMDITGISENELYLHLESEDNLGGYT